jgi:hypothetical protein
MTLREAGWIVGSPMADSPTPRPLEQQRQARLEARLTLYAQYAALVSDEVDAAWSADPARAGARTRELARARAELAAHFDELRAADDASSAVREAFGRVLEDVVTELDQQAALDRALRAQLETLRRLALPAGGTPAGDAPAEDSMDETPSRGTASDAGPEADDARDGVSAMGGALVAVRSSGLGGVLAGHYPGVVAGADATSYTDASAAAAPANAGGGRLDLRF